MKSISYRGFVFRWNYSEYTDHLCPEISGEFTNRGGNSLNCNVVYNKEYVSIPCYIYEHNGIVISLTPTTPYDSREYYYAEKSKFPDKTEEEIREILKTEVEDYIYWFETPVYIVQMYKTATIGGDSYITENPVYVQEIQTDRDIRTYEELFDKMINYIKR